MKRRVFRKLNSRAGESIAETLIALLISALALLMLAGAISAAARVVTTSKVAMDEYYAADAGIVQHETGEFVVSGEATVSLAGGSYPITYFENDRLGNAPVVSYVKGGASEP